MSKFIEFLRFIDMRSRVIMSIHFFCLIIIVIAAFLEINSYVYILQLPTLFYQLYTDAFYKRTMHEVSFDSSFWVDHSAELNEWIKDNVRWSVFFYKSIGSRYYFIRKTDAVGFKLRWVE